MLTPGMKLGNSKVSYTWETSLYYAKHFCLLQTTKLY